MCAWHEFFVNLHKVPILKQKVVPVWTMFFLNLLNHKAM